MEFPFPEIISHCPICGRGCGAIYRGYYRRWGIVPEASYFGWIAVRTGFCKYHKRRFALFPEFLVPFRSFSRQAFSRLAHAWIRRGVAMIQEVDRWFSDREQEMYLAASTLYSQLRLIVRELRLGWARFKVPPFSGASVWDLKLVEPDSFDVSILHHAFGLGASSRIDPPP